MKKLMVLSAIVLSGLTYQSASAQISFHFGVNLTPRPVYVEPAPVYNDAAYYYLPDVGAYYSVNEGCYYYQDGDSWVSAAYLPGAYRNYDWVHARRFAINQPRPYMHNDVYRSRYNGFEGRRDWGYRDNHFQQRTYAERGQFENNPYRGEQDHRGFDQRENHYGQFGGRENDHQQYENRGGNNRNYGGGQGMPQGERGGNQGNFGSGQQNQTQSNRGGNQNQGGGQGQPQGNQGQQQGNRGGGQNQGSQGNGNTRGNNNGGQGMRLRF